MGNIAKVVGESDSGRCSRENADCELLTLSFGRFAYSLTPCPATATEKS